MWPIPHFRRILVHTLNTLPTGPDGKSTSNPASFGLARYPNPIDQHDRDGWPALRLFLEQAFLTHTRDEWEAIFFDSDACVAPVLEPNEVAERDGGTEIPKPAPELSRTPARAILDKYESQETIYLQPGRDTMAILQELEIDNDEIARLSREGIIGNPVMRKAQRAKL